MANYSESIAKSITHYMDKNGLKYTFDPDRGIIKAGFNVSKDCIIGAIEVFIRVGESDFISSGICPIKAVSAHRDDTADLLTRLNWVLRNGNFEMDYSDGEIRYKVYVNCEDQELSDGIIEDAIHIPPSMFSQYGQSIADVILGVKDPETAFNDRKGPSKKTSTSTGSDSSSTGTASSSTDRDMSTIIKQILGMIDDE